MEWVVAALRAAVLSRSLCGPEEKGEGAQRREAIQPASATRDRRPNRSRILSTLSIEGLQGRKQGTICTRRARSAWCLARAGLRRRH